MRPTVTARRRLLLLRVLVLAAGLAILGRLWSLQVLDGPAYADQAHAQGTRITHTAAVRGRILDDQGRPLADNRTTLVLRVDDSVLSDQPDQGSAELHRLSTLLHRPVSELRAKLRRCGAHVPQPCWNGPPHQPIPVAKDVPQRAALQVLELPDRYPGVSVHPTAVRRYPRPAGASAAQLIGHLTADPGAGSDGNAVGPVGASGLEKSYDKALRGHDGTTVVRVDHLGDPVGTRSTTPPTPGDNVRTSIDAPLQALVEHALSQAVQQARTRTDASGRHFVAPSASGVVLDVKTGRVLALASYPTYDPNVWVGGISPKDYARLTSEPGHPLMDQAIAAQLAPGSTFKIISTAAAVAKDHQPLHGLYACPSSVTIAGQTLHNFAYESLGDITLAQALIHSCDTVYYELGYDEWKADQARIAHHQQPQENMLHMAQQFGLGRPTGIDLPGEAAGRLLGRAGKKKLWKQRRQDWCTGAKRRPKGSYLQRLDAENCTDGFVWRPGDAAQFAFGQGLTAVTPLQLAVAYAALANGGTVWSPRVAEAIVTPGGKVVRQVTPPVAGHVDVSPQVLGYIRRALAGVVRSGTASGAYAGFPLDKVAVAGKTGTASVAGKQSTAWFASFAPASSPRYVVVVMVQQAGQGGIAAAPATRLIYDGLFGLEGHRKVGPAAG